MSSKKLENTAMVNIHALIYLLPLIFETDFSVTICFMSAIVSSCVRFCGAVFNTGYLLDNRDAWVVTVRASKSAIILHNVLNFGFRRQIKNTMRNSYIEGDIFERFPRFCNFLDLLAKWLQHF